MTDAGGSPGFGATWLADLGVAIVKVEDPSAGGEPCPGWSGRTSTERSTQRTTPPGRAAVGAPPRHVATPFTQTPTTPSGDCVGSA